MEKRKITDSCAVVFVHFFLYVFFHFCQILEIKEGLCYNYDEILNAGGKY